jgi:hypothetical protein
MFRKLFSKKKILDDAAKLALAEDIAIQLITQTKAAGPRAAIDDSNGNPKRGPLGYVYGYIEASLRTNGHNVTDTSIGAPIAYHVLRRLWPDRVNDCMRVLFNNLSTDRQMLAAMKYGGKQCLDYRRQGGSDVPTGLAHLLIEGAKPKDEYH